MARSERVTSSHSMSSSAAKQTSGSQTLLRRGEVCQVYVRFSRNWCFSRRVLNVLTVSVCREHGEKRLEAVINAEVQLDAYGRLSVKTKMKL